MLVTNELVASSLKHQQLYYMFAKEAYFAVGWWFILGGVRGFLVNVVKARVAALYGGYGEKFYQHYQHNVMLGASIGIRLNGYRNSWYRHA